MKTKLFTNTASAIALATAGWLAAVTMTAQPMYDRIHVNLPYTVTLQNSTLQPGDYTIQQLPSASGDSRIILFYSQDGMKFETSATTIPTLYPNTPSAPQVIINHSASAPYL